MRKAFGVLLGLLWISLSVACGGNDGAQPCLPGAGHPCLDTSFQPDDQPGGSAESSGPSDTASDKQYVGSPTGPLATSDAASLLDSAVGFGRSLSGGQGGESYVVTTLDDSGPGSLREGLLGQAPRWITFGLSGTIALTSPLRVGSNKTIDGRGRHVVLSGFGLQIDNQSNIVIENIAFTAAEHGIHIDRWSRSVWVDHCHFKDIHGKSIQISRGSTDMTISWNHFEALPRAIVVGAQSAGFGDDAMRVTIHHNFFDKTGRANPELRFGRVHAYNNYLSRWTDYGMVVSDGGQLLSEGNVFEAGADSRAVQALDGNTFGCSRSHDDLAINGAQVEELRPDFVFQASRVYRYDAQIPDTAMADLIASEAGLQQTINP